MGASSTEHPFTAVAVLGLGVMGGSFARALSELEEGPLVIGWSPIADERDAALAAGAVDEATADWRDATRDVDLVVLAAPLAASCELLGRVGGSAPSRATLTDVASLKVPLARAAALAGVADRWVGCHPMAGSERSGFGASRADLYRGATVWTVANQAAKVREPGIHALWRSIGARPVEVDAEQHDRLMAMASHLPQLTANALASVLMTANVRADQLGPGGRDTTRLAASSADLWRDLLEHASPELVSGLRELSTAAARLADCLERRDADSIADIMRATRTWRQG